MTEERFITYDAAREIFATKADLAEFRGEVKTDIAEVRTEVAEFRAEVKTDIAEVRTEVAEFRAEVKADMAELRGEVKTNTAEMETRIIKWMVAAQIGGIAALATVTTAIIAFSRLLGS